VVTSRQHRSEEARDLLSFGASAASTDGRYSAMAEIAGASDIAALIVTWATSEASPFQNNTMYYDAEAIATFVQSAIGTGDVDFDGDSIDVAAVDGALHELLALQGQGITLGVLSRQRIGLSRLWCIVPPDAETIAAHGACAATLPATLRRVFEADELLVDDALVDRVLTSVAPLSSIAPLVAAIAAAAAPLAAAAVGIVVLLKIGNELVGEAEGNIQNQQGGAATAPKRRRASSVPADGASQSTVVHSVHELVKLLLHEGLQRVLLAQPGEDKALALRRERDALLGSSCATHSTIRATHGTRSVRSVG